MLNPLNLYKKLYSKTYKKRNSTLFITIISSEFAFAAANVNLSLLRHLKNKNFDFMVIYDDLSKQDRNAFLKMPNVILEKYLPPDGFEEKIKKVCPLFFKNTYKGKFIKFAKFEIFNYFKNYSNIIYLDVDIAIQKDFSELFRSNPLVTILDEDYKVQINFNKPVPYYDMEATGFCSSVMCYSTHKFNFDGVSSWCYAKAAELSPYFVNLDQGIFNLLIQEYNIDPILMDYRIYNCKPDQLSALSAKIIHFGPKKIWNNQDMAYTYGEWYRTHERWLELGGQDFPNRLFWEKRKIWHS